MLKSNHCAEAIAPTAGTLAALVEAQCDRTPDALALAGAGRRLTYAELERDAGP